MTEQPDLLNEQVAVEFRTIGNNQKAEQIIRSLKEIYTDPNARAITYIDPDEWEHDSGTLNAVLELIFSAPAYDGIRSNDIEYNLGKGLYAIIYSKNKDPVIATNPEFNIKRRISEDNFPTREGDLTPISGKPATYRGWKPVGPEFRVDTDDNKGTRIVRIAPPEDAFAVENVPNNTNGKTPTV